MERKESVESRKIEEGDGGRINMGGGGWGEFQFWKLIVKNEAEKRKWLKEVEEEEEEEEVEKGKERWRR